jgi:uracil-DNA glycosylase family 4
MVIQNKASYERTPLERLELKHRGWWGLRSAEFHSTYVGGEGQAHTKVMIIGEAPGAEEAVRGRPFVGPSGYVLRQLMNGAGLMASNHGNVRSNCWLTNVCKFRPPNNRKPTEFEIKQLRPLLRYEWQAIGRPKIIIPVGSTALFAVVGERWSILRVAGQLWTIHSARSNMDFSVWPMVHPAFALRNKEARPLLERDWDALIKWKKRGDT